MQVMYTKSIHHFFLLSQILLDVYLMYTKNVHHGNVIHTVYTICLQKVYYQCSNFGKGNLPAGQVKFFRKFKLQKNCNQCCSLNFLRGYLKVSWASTY